jgi:hypothetical protein
MARQLRVEYPGAIYRRLSRGDRQKGVCLDDVDRQSRRCGIKTPAEACQSRFAWGPGACVWPDAQPFSAGGRDAQSALRSLTRRSRNQERSVNS